MTLLVPFDGSPLSEAALVRASQFGTVLEEPVIAFSVIPRNNADYARDRSWIGTDESFDLETIITHLRESVTALCPATEFRYEVVDRYAPTGTIAQRVRKLAKTLEATLVFIGSENAGRLVASVSSVGRGVATDDAYDVVIIRSRKPRTIAALGDDNPR
ncbi:universal stress protein [Natronosalvus vescus]|uniref:universal stress protein n=1 Tax=Natronosalvus vescus TaxID=2953881 RepID=UPI002090607A|nr:universal stress protein [Natronosalvus vescus]